MSHAKLPKPSEEQLSVINGVGTYNIVVDSVAGSGKTTTNLYVSILHPGKKILLLTYNKKLKLETRWKVRDLGLNNMEIHSYHSFCVKYYKRDCFTDHEIIKILEKGLPPLKKFAYDFVIVDEAQDVCPLYYELICKIVKDNNRHINICILGDEYQSIYDFNKADPRFITLAQMIFDFNIREWRSVKFTTSFRITNQMADFVNNCMLGEKRIKACKEGENVRYLICDVFGKKGYNRAYGEVMYYLKKKYRYQDIFILAPSVKSSASPARQLANKLSDADIPIFVPVSDEEKLDEDILKGKIVFSTFHQVKGLERKCIIVFGFDQSYFKFFKKDKDPNICPNEMYVACTRGKEQLTVLHHYQNEFLPFINKEELKDNTYYEYMPLKIWKKKDEGNLNTPVTDLVKHLPVQIIQKALKNIKLTEIKARGQRIDIPVKTKQKFLYESVAEITGTAIPAFFEYLTTGKMSIFQEGLAFINVEADDKTDFVFIDVDGDIPEPDDEYSEEFIEAPCIQLKNMSVHELLFVANQWNADKSGYKYKMNQISSYNWLSAENLKRCTERLSQYISNEAKFEQRFEVEDLEELSNRRLVGYVDCIDKGNLWEFKCVSKLELEHIVQLAVYMYLYLSAKVFIEGDAITYKKDGLKFKGILEKIYKNGNMNVTSGNIKHKITKDEIIPDETSCSYFLYNILDDHLVEIKATYKDLKEMIQFLIQHKFFNSYNVSDKEFISIADDIKIKYA